MSNRRKYVRMPYHATVEISHPGFGILNVQTKDISDGGLAVNFGKNIPPPVGTLVHVVIKRYTGRVNAEPLPMRVVYVQPQGQVGLAFESESKS